MTSTAEAPATTDTAARPGWSFLRSRRWLSYFAMLLVFSVSCVYLGNWQFDRRAQAQAEIARIDNNYEAVATPLASQLGALTDYDDDLHKWLPVVVTGEYIGTTWLARGRPGPSGVGSNLINAFRADDGRVFFVDRGWVPVIAEEAVNGSLDWNDLPAPPDGRVTLEARLRAGEPQVQGRTTDGHTLGSIELPELARLTGTESEAYTGAYGMLISERPASEHGTLPEKPERDEGPHLSYALQWYVFILIAIAGVAYAATREYRSFNPNGAALLAHDRRVAERRKRRGPSDADEEDALLDD